MSERRSVLAPSRGLVFIHLSLLAAGCDDGNPTRATAPSGELPPRVSLATVPPSFSDVLVASGLANPTLMAIAPDGRIFVSEQAGAVRIIKNGSLLSTPFVTLSVNSAGERGALGITFDPAFTTTGRVFVYYTASTGPHNRVSRFTASGDVAVGGETVILDLPTLSSATNHNGGAIHFGPDGKLYVAVGDNANGANSQSLTTTLGKILRINPDGTIPSDNPFFGGTTGINRSIWALGLRNPYTFAFDPLGTRMFINDVGQNTWEEINDGIAGANYGWSTTEGPTTDPRFVSPFYAYDHGAGCAITGGDFYHPTNGFPASYLGDYFFADYCAGWIRSLDPGTGAVASFATGISSPTDIQVGDDGALYYIARGNGSIRKISYTASTAPVISQHPADQIVPVGGSVSFTVVATGSTPLGYQWQRNQVNIPGATSATYTLANVQSSDNGARFRCVVSNTAGSATSNEAVLTVTSNAAPTADITAPTASTTFQGGQTISYAGTGTDPEDGTLPGASLTWSAMLWHDDGNPHAHPFYGPTTGSSGSFTIPSQGETSPNIWYRIHLTAVDGQGSTHTDSVDIQPRRATVTLATSPAGLQLELDGVPVTAPFTFTGVVGIERTIEAVSPQTVSGQTWVFSAWSDGGSASHPISTPVSATTITATFVQSSGQVYEAENALVSGAKIGSEGSGYTGTGYVRFVRNSGEYIEWTVTATAAGPVSLDFRHALGGSTTRSLRVTVNGATVRGNEPFPPTGGWNTWAARTVPATLQAGPNRVRVTSTGTKGPRIDHLMVR